ncbi:MAG: hypothetical protein AB8W37_05565, partial [Arsenophonus endosymbiont of Dermacentor nuttalli]
MVVCPLWAAINGANVICSNKDVPTDNVTEKHIKYNVGQLIQYKEVNALKIPYENKLDVIMSSCHHVIMSSCHHVIMS